MAKTRTIIFKRPIVEDEKDTFWTTRIKIFDDVRGRNYWSVGSLGLGIGTIKSVTREEAKELIKRGGGQEVK